MSWYEQNPDLHASEISALRRRFPDVEICRSKGLFTLMGLFPVTEGNGSILKKYNLHVIFPFNYPLWVPETFMMEPGVTKNADRHIEPDGRACLCLPHEIPGYFPDGISFEMYFDGLVHPWLIGQAFFDENGKWPWQTWDHGKDGILRGFSKLLGFIDLDIVERFVRLLIRKNPAKGHELCPCGSGRKLRNCHSDIYRRCSDQVSDQARKIYRDIFKRYDAR